VLLFSCTEHEHPDEDLDPKGRNHPIVDQLNESDGVKLYGGRFVRLDHLAGGNKAFEASMYATAFNYLSVEALAVALSTLPWKNRESVQLLLQGQNDDAFTIHPLR
jgi:hypothetical protein